MSPSHPENPHRKADEARRREENAAGVYFIDDECISCGACWKVAPELISSHPIHAFAFFQRQPLSLSETKQADEALFICPVGAIGRSEVL